MVNIDAPNRGPCISDDDDDDDDELIDPRKVRRANATQTNVRDSEPEHINAANTNTSSHEKPTVPPLNATKPSKPPNVLPNLLIYLVLVTLHGDRTG